MPDKFPFYTVEGSSYKVLFPDSTTFDGIKMFSEIGLTLQFSVTDLFGNKIDSILIQRNNPDLGQITYKIMKDDILVVKKNIMFLGMFETNNC